METTMEITVDTDDTRTNPERAITALKRNYAELQAEMAKVLKAIEQGKPIELDLWKANHLKYGLLEQISMGVEELAKFNRTAEMEKRRQAVLQDAVHEVLHEYVEDNELSPSLLEGSTENMVVRCSRSEQTDLYGEEHFPLPCALLENHRAEVTERLEEAFMEMGDEEVLDMEVEDSRVSHDEWTIL